MNDPTAQMGFQLGKSAVDAGHQYMEQNVSHMRLEHSRMSMGSHVENSHSKA